MGFQENLRRYREQAGYMQAKDFAKVLGISYPTYMGYENRGREPRYALLIRIARRLHVSIDDLLGNDSEQPDETIQILDFFEKIGYKTGQENDDNGKVVFHITAQNGHSFYIESKHILVGIYQNIMQDRDTNLILNRQYYLTTLAELLNWEDVVRDFHDS